MLNSKQRSYLKGLASKENALIQIGKGGVTPLVINAIDEALEKRELVKLNVLNNCMDDARTLSDIIAGRTRSEVVLVIGKKIVLYRESKENKTIELPKSK